MSPSHAMSPRAVSGGDPHRVFGMLEPKRCTPVRLILGRTFEDEAGEDVHPELAVPEHRFSRRACHFRVAALWGRAGARTARGSAAEGSMAGRDPFTETFFASEDPSCSPPNAFGGETQGIGVRSTSGTRSSFSQGAVGHPLVGHPLVGHPLERDREGLPARGSCDSPIGGPILAVGRASCSGRSPPTTLQESKNRPGPMIRGPRRGRSRCLSECRVVRRFPCAFWPVKKGTPSA